MSGALERLPLAEFIHKRAVGGAYSHGLMATVLRRPSHRKAERALGEVRAPPPFRPLCRHLHMCPHPTATISLHFSLSDFIFGGNFSVPVKRY